VRPAASQLLQQRRQALDRGIDHIGAHRVRNVQDQMHHQECSDRRFFNPPYFQVADTAAVAGQTRVEIADLLDELSLVRRKQVLSFVDIRQIEQLHLADHFL